MNCDLMEDFSRLMDGEPTVRSKESLIEYLVDHPEARMLWQRYHLIRRSLKNDLKEGPSMVSRVRSVIDTEKAPWELTFKISDKD